MDIKNINVLDKNIELFSSAYPIGYVYEQYPGQKSPNELWGEYSVWEELDYNGAFFYTCEDSNFETKLSVQSVDDDFIIFTEIYEEMASDKIIYDYKHNESRLITGLGGARIAYIDRPFSNTDIDEVIISQASSYRQHSHGMSHNHSISSSTSFNAGVIVCLMWNNYDRIIYDYEYQEWSPDYQRCSFGISSTRGGTYANILSISTSVSASTSTSIHGPSTPDSGYAGSIETRPINFTYRLWKRVS